MTDQNKAKKRELKEEENKKEWLKKNKPEPHSVAELRKMAFQDKKKNKKEMDEIVNEQKSEEIDKNEALEKAQEVVEKKIDQTSSKGKKSDSDDEEEVAQLAENIYQLSDAEDQISKLVSLAIQKDPFVAIKVAKHLDSNYIMDKLHDELLEDKIRKVLFEKGILEELK